MTSSCDHRHDCGDSFRQPCGGASWQEWHGGPVQTIFRCFAESLPIAESSGVGHRQLLLQSLGVKMAVIWGLLSAGGIGIGSFERTGPGIVRLLDDSSG